MRTTIDIKATAVTVQHLPKKIAFGKIYRGDRFVDFDGLWVKCHDSSAVCISHKLSSRPPGWIASGFKSGHQVQLVETTF